ncbi:hypothetical protein Ancab_020311 [Ancistrocladus abbreviatus]
MLQIRLNKGSAADGSTGPKSLPMETVTVACPDHLVLADLPVAKGLGSATPASRVKIVGRRSRRQLGERVHFCVRCDFPIAIYGRLVHFQSPCEHAFCLDCARSDSICYLCDERIQKIQTIKMMEGIFICAAPHCLKSFLKKMEFESHIHECHADLLQPNLKKEEVNESDSFVVKQPAASDSSVRSNPQPNDREDRARRQQSREQAPLRPLMQPKLPPYHGQTQSQSADHQTDNRPPGIDSSAPPNRVHQQSFDPQVRMQQEFGQFSDKQQQQQGIVSEQPHHEYPPLYFQPPPNYQMPSNTNQVLPTPPPPFGFPPFPLDGAPPFYGAPSPYEMPRSESVVIGSEQGSLLGFPPLPTGPVNFPENFPRPWSGGPSASAPFEAVQGAQGMTDGSVNPSDPHGRGPFYQGDYGRSSGNLPPNPLYPPMSSKAMEQMQAVNSMDVKGLLAPPPMMPPPPPGPPPAHLLQQKHSNYPSGDASHVGKDYGWQHEKRDSFASSQD